MLTAIYSQTKWWPEFYLSWVSLIYKSKSQFLCKYPALRLCKEALCLFSVRSGKSCEDSWIYFQHEKPIMREESLRPQKDAVQCKVIDTSLLFTTVVTNNWMGFVSMVSTMIYGLRVALFIMDLYKREKNIINELPIPSKMFVCSLWLLQYSQTAVTSSGELRASHTDLNLFWALGGCRPIRAKKAEPGLWLAAAAGRWLGLAVLRGDMLRLLRTVSPTCWTLQY